MSLVTRPLLGARQGALIFRRGLKKKTRIPVTMLKTVPKVGSEGSVVQVSKAFMRHELYPKRLADYVLTYKGPLDRSKAAAAGSTAESAEEALATEAEAQRRTHSLALKNQEALAQIMALGPLVFERNVLPAEAADGGDEESQAIYGSLTKADVAKALSEQHGIQVEKDALNMDDKIKSTGEYTCTVKLIYAGQATLRVKVVPAAAAATGSDAA
ncbi:hypothetical protein GGF46_001426 [Coemansia sp. RSA 552]|nr:hypothetical protein GGF46_001426 [Coemansia sp. RSA 552]